MIQAPKQSHTQKAAKPEIYRAPVFMVYFCPHTQQHAGISVRDASPFLLALPVRHGRMSMGNIMPRAESVRNALFCHKRKETYMLCAAAMAFWRPLSPPDWNMHDLLCGKHACKGAQRRPSDQGTNRFYLRL